MFRNGTVFGLSAGLALGACLVATTNAAALSSVQDQSHLDLENMFPISNTITADDLNFAVNSRIDTITVWLADSSVNDNGIFDGFSGSLSWAIYSDQLGPDVRYNSGTDSAPLITDTHVQTTDGHDVFRVRIDLDGRPIVGPSRVWLLVHEGAWGSAGDGSSIYWLQSQTSSGSAAFVSANETNPAPADWFPAETDAAFVVEADPHDWFQGFINTNSGANISAYVSANDFILPTGRTLGSVDAWLADLGPDNGHWDNFSGNLSWGIYANTASGPGELLVSGVDTTTQGIDSGLNMAGGGDIIRTRIEFNPRPVLPAGTYWLALHEGFWLQASDGSPIYWLFSDAVNAVEYQAIDETFPTVWNPMSNTDSAFVLFQDSLFANGFDAGATCAWSSVNVGGTCP